MYSFIKKTEVKRICVIILMRYEFHKPTPTIAGTPAKLRPGHDPNLQIPGVYTHKLARIQEILNAISR
jgi:predicted alpha/beta-hydrolase family hydrolase